MKKEKIFNIVSLVIVGVLTIASIILTIYAFIIYKTTPINEVPLWVLWLLWK